MRSAVGAKGMKIEGARSEGSGGRRIEDFLGKEDSPSRSASRWHRSICCSFFSPSFSFITPNSRPRESLFLSLPVSLLLPPFSLFLPPSLPSPLSPDIFLSSRIFSPLVLSSFSLSFDFSLDFFENAAPIHHRRATIIMQSVLAPTGSKKRDPEAFVAAAAAPLELTVLDSLARRSSFFANRTRGRSSPISSPSFFSSTKTGQLFSWNLDSRAEIKMVYEYVRVQIDLEIEKRIGAIVCSFLLFRGQGKESRRRRTRS